MVGRERQDEARRRQQERLATALRANLKRRKAQQRGRTSPESQAAAQPQEASDNPNR
jgi:hypothetical protein